jgi:hypothetical protein
VNPMMEPGLTSVSPPRSDGVIRDRWSKSI